MDLWIWVISAAIAVALILMINPIIKYTMVFRHRQPKNGVPLEEFLDRTGGRIPSGEALEMLEPVIRKLAQFHTNGRSHMDVCPQRIVVVPETKKAALLAPGGRRLMRPGYSAPEQYGGKKGTWADVYAAACVLYRMTTGKNPPDALLRVQDDSEVPREAAGVDMPDGIRQAWLRALSLEPRARFRDCGLLAQELYPHVKPPAEQVELKKR